MDQRRRLWLGVVLQHRQRRHHAESDQEAAETRDELHDRAKLAMVCQGRQGGPWPSAHQLPRCQVRSGSIRAASSTRAPGNATVGLTHSNSQIPARPDVHTVRRHRFSGVRRAARRAHGVAAAILEGRPDRGRHQGPILKKDHRFTTETGERGNSKHGSARPSARAPSNASSGMPWTACCPNRSATFWSVRRSSGLGSPRSSTSSTSGLRCEHGRDS
jgi:hypothetical protein